MHDQLSERHYQRLAQILEGHVGIRLPAAKRVMVEGRLRKRVRSLGLDSLDEYCRLLFEHDRLDDEFVHLVDLVTTNKTDFFREPEHFEFLTGQALPALLQGRAGGRERQLKVWSAAS